MKKFNVLAALLVAGLIVSPSVVWAADQGAVAAKDAVKKEVVKKAPKYVASSQSQTKLYHVPTCPAAKSIKAANLVGFPSKAEAGKAGYAPHDCVPSKAQS